MHIRKQHRPAAVTETIPYRGHGNRAVIAKLDSQIPAAHQVIPSSAAGQPLPAVTEGQGIRHVALDLMRYIARVNGADCLSTTYRLAIQWQGGAPNKDYVPFLGLGRTLVSQNKPGEALPYAVEAVRLSPNEVSCRQLLGKTYSLVKQTRACENRTGRGGSA